jgi:hypothetical protein
VHYRAVRENLARQAQLQKQYYLLEPASRSIRQSDPEFCSGSDASAGQSRARAVPGEIRQTIESQKSRSGSSTGPDGEPRRLRRSTSSSGANAAGSSAPRGGRAGKSPRLSRDADTGASENLPVEDVDPPRHSIRSRGRHGTGRFRRSIV